VEHAGHDYTKADLPQPVRALCDFAVKVTHASPQVRREDIDELRGHGWSDAAISDAIQVISYFNYINRVADAIGIDDEPEWGNATGPPPTAG
jgi:uncharacterized peroxidase-related enzyme